MAPFDARTGAMKTCGIKEALEIGGGSKPGLAWNGNRKKMRGRVVRGVGIGTGTMGGGSKQRGHQACAAMLRLCEDGTVNYLTGATDCGQGSDTVLVQIIAEELGIRMEDISIRRVDTAVTPCDPGSYGSRVTILAGQAAQKAAQDIKQQLASHVAAVWGVPESGIEFGIGRVWSTDDPKLSMPFRKLAQAACYSESGRVILGRGYSQTEAEDYNFEEGSGNSDVNYSFVAQLTEVEVSI
ncbi:MAG: molybdopterin-dependent oxidoreductase, partial [Sulfuritalea sp.]|nr:molybdopterin-dependent oxidoreductase [Sulfuritalea sp.]